MRLLLVGSVVLVAGCSLDRAGVAGDVDAFVVVPDSGIDSGVIPPGDAGLDSGLDSGVDAGVDGGLDGGIDGGIDSGVDGGIDAAIDAGMPTLTCDEIYAGAPGFVLCTETTTSCEIFVNPSGSASCDSICRMFFGSCVGARNEGSGDVCGSGSSYPCSESHSDGVCICSRF